MSYDTNLDRLTVTDLRAIAADLKIYGRSKMKRAELVAAITRAEMNAQWSAAPAEETAKQDAPAPTPTIDNHAAAVAQLRANREAEEEERAAARRARNRTNYAPATEVAEQADTEAGELLDAVLGERADSSVTVTVDRYSEGRASVKMQGHPFGDMTREAYRIGRKWELVDQEHGIVFFTIRAGSLQKAVKAWAKKLNTHAERIDVARSF